MAKLIKRVGIVFFVLVVSLLLLIGCTFTLLVNDKDIENESVNLSNNVDKTIDSDYLVSGDFQTMQDIWNNAVQESLDKQKKIKVTLEDNWVAQNDNNYSKSFGKGIGFSVGKIAIPAGASILLDLNGKTIDRSLTTLITSGSVFAVYGSLDIIDSCYNATNIYNIYESKKSNKDELVSSLKNSNCGKITGGNSYHGGGFIVYTNGHLNIYGGMFINNKASAGGGVVSTETHSVVTIYDGLFIENTCDIDGGVVYSREEFTINGGLFINNTARYGGAIYSQASRGNIVVNDAIMAYNNATGSGGASYSHSYARTDFNGGVYYKNKSTENGGAISGTNHVSIYIANVDIYENTARNGGGIGWNSDSEGEIILESGKIHNNTATNVGGGFYWTLIPSVKLSGPMQIYDNVANGSSSDMYILKTNKIEICTSKLFSPTASAYIGISLAEDYGEEPFTIGYGYYKNTIAPNKIFYSNNTNFPIVKSGEEVALGTSGTKPTTTCEWIVTPEGGTPIKTTSNNLSVVYNGKPFTLTNSKGTFYRGGTNNAISSFNQLQNVGSYAFYSNENIKNQVFTLTIVPKEVELEWSNTNLVYNGVSQLPTVRVKASDLCGSDVCTVNITGGQILVGNYITNMLSISNDNYKLKASVKKYSEFTISEANLIVDLATNNITTNYNESNIDIGDNWYNYSTTGLLGQDSGKTLDSLFKIDKSAFIPQFTKDGITLDNVINKGEYEISVKEFDANKVFSGNGNYNVTINYVNGGVLSITEANVIRASVESGYSYLVLEDDNRVTYAQKGLLHGDNDSEIERYILGNIKPNTSVKEFVNNLVYDKTQIEIYNNKNKLIYNKGVAASGITEEMLNQKYELAVGTGWYIKTSVETIYLSVLGDVTGDGRISAVDVTYLRQIANDKEVYNNLSVEKKLASLVLNVGLVTTADAEIIRNIMDNKISIELFY